jgi:hypothetical protein
MRRYPSVVVLCWLIAVPSLLIARAPAPLDLEESAAAAERRLVKQYGADAKGIKGAWGERDAPNFTRSSHLDDRRIQ